MMLAHRSLQGTWNSPCKMHLDVFPAFESPGSMRRTEVSNKRGMLHLQYMWTFPRRLNLHEANIGIKCVDRASKSPKDLRAFKNAH